MVGLISTNISVNKLLAAYVCMARIDRICLVWDKQTCQTETDVHRPRESERESERERESSGRVGRVRGCPVVNTRSMCARGPERVRERETVELRLLTVLIRF